MAILEWVMPGNFAQLLHTNTALIGSLTGFLSHRLYFGRGNPHKKDQSARRIIDVLFTCHLLLTSYFVKTDGCSGGLKLSAAFAFFFYLGLFGTLVVYRLWFHPLRKFPGPFWGKVTGFYGLYLARNARYVWETEKLMEEYGVDFLRFKPNEILMADLDLWLNANNNTTVFHKADNYDQHQHNGVNSLPFDRDKPHHAMRRKVWEKAFTGAQLKHYETPITNCVKEFLDVAAAAAAKGKSIDVSTYSLMMVCDIMGQVGFSKNFNAIKTAKSDMIRLLTALFGPVGKVGRMQWPLYVLKGFNIKPPAVTEWEAWFTTELKERLDRGEKQECNDIMTPLIEAYHESPRTEKDYAVLENDTGAVIVAATDTVGATLAWVYYFLCKHPHYQVKLREEVASAFAESPSPSNAVLAKLPLLTGVIQETLRLNVAVANAGRIVPPEGYMHNGVFLPGGTTIFSCPRSISRSEKYFARGKEFIPERWYIQKDLVIREKAMVAFNWGQWNCVGKQMALIELRVLIAHLVHGFEIEFASKDEQRRMEEECKDYVIMKCPPLHVNFKKLN